ncbi:tRNA (34-2'-O)-methyltransferase regulator WDR6 [Cloeon dipterum]|uniref:tRNA (34-2'-O)-methyltransferase regulator WDR6 n=1 Tax=Cloeon dipterum TaxID=197152 RepID=UPI00321FB3E8
MKAKTIRINTDVTAVKILGNKIFAGVGGHVHIFSVENGSSRIDATLEIFEGQKIHGFCHNTERDEIVVFGGRLFLIFQLKKLKECSIIDSPVHKVSHWIQAVHWLQDGSIALALSNNMVKQWKDGQIIASVQCPIKCIIYSALLLGSSWDSLVVFSGTVFSEVLIWGSDGQVWHQLKGHKGVIFSISFDKSRQRLLTSSDDRSVRVWQKSADSTWSSCSLEQVQELYGHQSRVWRALPSKFGLVSIGEDSFVCQWDDSGKELSKMCSHQGGSIWSIDICDSYLVTGGGDGGIMCWNLEHGFETKQFGSPVNVRKVAWTPKGELLVVTEDEKLFIMQECGSIEQAPFNVQMIEIFQDLIYLTTVSGNLTLVKDVRSKEAFLTGRVSDGAAVLSVVPLKPTTFLVSLSSGERIFWGFENGTLERLASYTASPKTKGVSCGLCIGDYCVIGDQDGFLQLFNWKSMEVEQNLNMKSEGVTGICMFRGLIWATCKEGKLLTLLLEHGQISIVNSGQPRLGMLAGLEVTSLGLLLYSFHRVNFSVWSWDQQRPIFKFHCPGGGHRSWDFRLSSENKMCFAFVRHKKAFYQQQRLKDVAAPVLRTGLHLNLINCMVPLDSNHLLSGGEDGSLRISDAVSGSSCTVIQAHLSSVKALLKDKNILVSAGGRAQLAVWQILNINSNWILKLVTSHMLLESAEKSVKAPWRDSYLNPRADPESRYMALCLLSHNESKLVFLAACSDSFLRIF